MLDLRLTPCLVLRNRLNGSPGKLGSLWIEKGERWGTTRERREHVRDLRVCVPTEHPDSVLKGRDARREGGTQLSAAFANHNTRRRRRSSLQCDQSGSGISVPVVSKCSGPRRQRCRSRTTRSGGFGTPLRRPGDSTRGSPAFLGPTRCYPRPIPILGGPVRRPTHQTPNSRVAAPNRSTAATRLAGDQTCSRARCALRSRDRFHPLGVTFARALRRQSSRPPARSPASAMPRLRSPARGPRNPQNDGSGSYTRRWSLPCSSRFRVLRWGRQVWIPPAGRRTSSAVYSKNSWVWGERPSQPARPGSCCQPDWTAL